MRSQYPDENSSYDRRYDSAVESDADAVRLEGTGAKFYGEVIQPIYISKNFNSNTVSYLDTTAVAGVRYDYVVTVHPVGSSSHSAAATGWRSISNSAALDSDGDGISDAHEIAEATDKFDPGS